MVYEVFAVSRGRGDGARRAINDGDPRRRAAAENNERHQLTPLSLGQGRPRPRELLVAGRADAKGSQTRAISSGG